VTPDDAAKTLIKWTDGLDMSKSGEYWAPRGPGQSDLNQLDISSAKADNGFTGDIGTAEAVLGPGLPTPLQLPW
jgi:hypothetical protein